MYNNPRYRAKLVYINTDYNGIAIFDYEEDEYDCLYYATGFDSNSIAKLKCWAENEEFDNIRDFIRNWFEWGGNSHAVSNFEQFKNSADFERWIEL